jgi:hypothetical protein
MRANGWANKSGHMGAEYNILRDPNGPFCFFVSSAPCSRLFDLDQCFSFPHKHIIHSEYVALKK